MTDKKHNLILGRSNLCEHCRSGLQPVHGSLVCLNEMCPMKGTKQITCCGGHNRYLEDSSKKEDT